MDPKCNQEDVHLLKDLLITQEFQPPIISKTRKLTDKWWSIIINSKHNKIIRLNSKNLWRKRKLSLTLIRNQQGGQVKVKTIAQRIHMDQPLRLIGILQNIFKVDHCLLMDKHGLQLNWHFLKSFLCFLSSLQWLLMHFSFHWQDIMKSRL